MTTSALLLEISTEMSSDQHLTICLCYSGKDEVGQVGLNNAYWFAPLLVRGDQTVPRMTMAITNTEHDKVTCREGERKRLDS